MSIVYERSGDIIEITIRDSTMRKVGSWKFNAADKELANGIFRHIQRKYGFSPEIMPKENISDKVSLKADW